MSQENKSYLMTKNSLNPMLLGKQLICHPLSVCFVNQLELISLCV